MGKRSHVLAAMSAAGLMIAIILAPGSSMARAESLTVKVAQGKIHGESINDGKVNAYLGLPYAAPPVGDLRWRPPQPPAHWHGTRDATHYGAHCMQGHVFADILFQDSGPSENCLYLNVYTPSGATAKSKLPVMFWIHGGGFAAGSGSEPRHDGDFLPTKGVVLVTINYRLGVFGFLATPALAAEQGGSAGNYGLMDMAAALRWVNENIAAFGGDPNNVTIFGESAGSIAVSALMAAAPAQGLFQKAIGESGGALDFFDGPSSPSTQQAMKQEQAWVDSLGVDMKHLREMPAETILEDSLRKGAPQFWPVVDGRFITEPVAETYAAGKQAHVPLLAGWNRDEMPYLAMGMTVEKWKAFAKKVFGDHAAEFLRYYPGDTDAQAQRSAIDYGSDRFIAFSTWHWIHSQVKTGDSPVYRYHFELPAPASKYHPGGYAFHSDDIDYVFGTLNMRPGAVWRPEDRTLSNAMMDYWTNFARTGNPNGDGLPEWPRFDTTHEILHLANPITAGPDTTEARYEFLLKWMPKTPIF